MGSRPWVMVSIKLFFLKNPLLYWVNLSVRLPSFVRPFSAARGGVSVHRYYLSYLYCRRTIRPSKSFALLWGSGLELSLIPFLMSYSCLPKYFFDQTYMNISTSMRIWNTNLLSTLHHELMPSAGKRPQVFKGSEFPNQFYPWNIGRHLCDCHCLHI